MRTVTRPNPSTRVINGENFHALETLLYAYEGKVDCIYIDPPYNTGAKDWKYNNDYVDKDDVYRHSLWLSFMEKRLKLAQRLLNPRDSVLIVTIDEKEYLRLGLLLEQSFKGWKIQMVSSVINPRGIVRENEFSRSNEFVFFVWTPGAKIAPALIEASEGVPVDWETMRRRAIEGRRGRKGKGACGPNQFYAIYVDEKTGHIVGRGDPLPTNYDINRYRAPRGIAVFPIRDDGTEMNWSLTDKAFDERWAQGYVRAGKATPAKPQKYLIQYVLGGVIEDIADGKAVITGKQPDGSVIAEYVEQKSVMAHTQWDIASHNAQQHGTGLLGRLLPGRKFPYAKSLYAVEDALRYFVLDKPDALVLDFFSGSGTTAHAVMRLNRQHGGQRRSILVTNNEVGAAEQESLRAQGQQPGDEAWEQLGICESVTKPRIDAAISGVTPSGDPIVGDYRFNAIYPMSDGLEENARFFRLTYLDPEALEAKRSFDQIAHLLWLIAGAEGPVIDEESSSGWALPKGAKYGVLFRNKGRAAFAEALGQRYTSGEPPRHVFIVADSTDEFHRSMEQVGANPAHTTRLYRHYLRNFRTNVFDLKEEL
jgi:adenine-specific DNA-methyltransferase